MINFIEESSSSQYYSNKENTISNINSYNSSEDSDLNNYNEYKEEKTVFYFEDDSLISYYDNFYS